jgi:uncharacterized membrane protein YqhA
MSTTINKKPIQNFISRIANKDYANAQAALQDAVADKLKVKIRNYISQEK